jgi:hypothetical protein
VKEGMRQQAVGKILRFAMLRQTSAPVFNRVAVIALGGIVAIKETVESNREKEV